MAVSTWPGDDRAWSVGTLILRPAISAITLVLLTVLLRQPPDWLSGSLMSVALALAAVASLDFLLTISRLIRATPLPWIRRRWARRWLARPSDSQSHTSQPASVDRAIEGLVDDQFGFAKYAFVLAEFIAWCSTPMTIGIHGEWGTGKTSLAKLIEQFLNQRGPEWSEGRLLNIQKDLETSGYKLEERLPPELVQKRVIIWLNAWQYADAQSLWRAFILRLASEMEKRGLVGSTQEWQTKLFYNITQEGKGEVRLGNAAITLAALGAIAMFLGSLLLPSTWVLLALANLGIAGDAKFKLPSLDNVFERSKYTKMRKQMDSIDQFRGELQGLIDRLLERPDDTSKAHRKSNQPDDTAKDASNGTANDTSKVEPKVILFIDDLDRCTPNVALEITETIKTFLDVKGCVRASV